MNNYKAMFWLSVVVILLLLGIMVASGVNAQTSVPCSLYAEGNYTYKQHSYSANGKQLICKYKLGDWRPPN